MMVILSVEGSLNCTKVNQELREDTELDTITGPVFKWLPQLQILMKSKNFKDYQRENYQEIILGSEIYSNTCKKFQNPKIGEKWLSMGPPLIFSPKFLFTKMIQNGFLYLQSKFNKEVPCTLKGCQKCITMCPIILNFCQVIILYSVLLNNRTCSSSSSSSGKALGICSAWT